MVVKDAKFFLIRCINSYISISELICVRSLENSLLVQYLNISIIFFLFERIRMMENMSIHHAWGKDGTPVTGMQGKAPNQLT